MCRATGDSRVVVLPQIETAVPRSWEGSSSRSKWVVKEGMVIQPEVSRLWLGCGFHLEVWNKCSEGTMAGSRAALMLPW